MKCLLAMICAFTLFNILTAQKPFVLKGRLTGKDTGIVYLKYNRHGFVGTDSVKLVNNAFEFKGLLAEPVLASLTFRSDSHSPRTELYTDFYLEPKNVQLDLTWNKPDKTSVKGSVLDKEYHKLKSLSDPLLISFYKVKAGIPSGATKADSLKYLQNKIENILSKFINENPLSIVSAHAMVKLIYLKELSPDSGLVLLRSLDTGVQQSEYCSRAIEGLSKISAAAIGKAAPDFTRTDINGKQISLSDLKGKYVLLEYWASWCGPCRELTPTIKEYYRKYRDLGFEVVFISCDSKYDAWKKAVADDGIGSFINILSFSKEDMEYLKTNSNMQHASFKGELRKLYNLNPIPAKILIDKEGRIIGRYGEQDGEPNDKLESMLASLKK